MTRRPSFKSYVSGRWPVLVFSWFILATCVCLLPSNSLLAQSRKADQWEDEIVPKGRYIFRWGFQKGQRFQFQLNQKIVTQTKGGLVNAGEVPIQWSITQQWDVESREKDVVTVLQTMRAISFRFTQPTLGEVHADTNQPAPTLPIANKLHKDLSKLIGQQTRMKIDKLGNISYFKAVGDAEVLKGSAVASSFSPAQLRSTFSQIAVFKSLTYKPGDSWNNTHKLKMGPADAQLDINFSFLSVSEGSPQVATVKLEPELKILSEQGPFTITRQEGEGQLLYSVDQMLILGTNLHHELEVQIQPEAAEGLPITQTTKTDTEIEFKLLEDGSEQGIESSEEVPQDTSDGK